MQLLRSFNVILLIDYSKSGPDISGRAFAVLPDGLMIEKTIVNTTSKARPNTTVIMGGMATPGAPHKIILQRGVMPEHATAKELDVLKMASELMDLVAAESLRKYE